jgi:aspartate carbamoyltransferase catalytic subunit
MDLGHRRGTLDFDEFDTRLSAIGPVVRGQLFRPLSEISLIFDSRLRGSYYYVLRDRKRRAALHHQLLRSVDAQLERQRGNLYPSLREYARVYGVTRERLLRARPDVTVMHPGPMNRGVEIAQDVADGEHSVILEQVTNGVAVRMAVLYLLAGGERDAPAQER